MTRTYALKRLLEHGPMTLQEIAECTGWGYRESWSTVCKCLKTQTIVRRQWGGYGFAYEAENV